MVPLPRAFPHGIFPDCPHIFIYHPFACTFSGEKLETFPLFCGQWRHAVWVWLSNHPQSCGLWLAFSLRKSKDSKCIMWQTDPATMSLSPAIDTHAALRKSKYHWNEIKKNININLKRKILDKIIYFKN